MLWTTFFLILLSVVFAGLFAAAFIWSIKSNQYTDVEEPKYQMLRNED